MSIKIKQKSDKDLDFPFTFHEQLIWNTTAFPLNQKKQAKSICIQNVQALVDCNKQDKPKAEKLKKMDFF